MKLVNAMRNAASALMIFDDDEQGLHADCEKWLQELTPHRSASADLEVGCTTAPEGRLS